jgi:hypothetical protein
MVVLPTVSLATKQPPIASSTRNELIKKIALACLKEFAISLILGLAVCCFVPSVVGISAVITASLIQLAVSIFFHSLGTYADYKVSQKGGNVAFFQNLRTIAEWVTGANFALFTGFNTQMLIHEGGHALAAIAAYKRPRPQMILYPFNGGLTQFYKTTLTPFGKKLGPVATTCFVIASGPGLTLLISTVLFAIGVAIQKKYPQVGKYLIAWGILDFANHAQYALSALWADPSRLAHDFVHLSIFGLHPVVAGIGIIAIPIIVGLGIMWFQKGSPPQKDILPLSFAC